MRDGRKQPERTSDRFRRRPNDRWLYTHMSWRRYASRAPLWKWCLMLAGPGRSRPRRCPVCGGDAHRADVRGVDAGEHPYSLGVLGRPTRLSRCRSGRSVSPVIAAPYGTNWATAAGQGGVPVGVAATPSPSGRVRHRPADTGRGEASSAGCPCNGEQSYAGMPTGYPAAGGNGAESLVGRSWWSARAALDDLMPCIVR
jgi:hypothetical protein